jgi:hypothetical protein
MSRPGYRAYNMMVVVRISVRHPRTTCQRRSSNSVTQRGKYNVHLSMGAQPALKPADCVLEMHVSAGRAMLGFGEVVALSQTTC